MHLWLISRPEKKLAIQRTIHNRHHSLPLLQLAKPLLLTTIYTYNHYRYRCKTLSIVFRLMVRPTTARINLCTCLYKMSRHLHDDTSLYYITFFVERYINKTSSLLLKDTGHSPHNQYNYSLLWILLYAKNYY